MVSSRESFSCSRLVSLDSLDSVLDEEIDNLVHKGRIPPDVAQYGYLHIPPLLLQ